MGAASLFAVTVGTLDGSLIVATSLLDQVSSQQVVLCVLRLSKTSNFWVFSHHIMGYDPPKKSWVMAYRRLMGYPPYPNSGRAKKYGVPGIMGYQDLWVKGTSTVHNFGAAQKIAQHATRHLLPPSVHAERVAAACQTTGEK